MNKKIIKMTVDEIHIELFKLLKDLDELFQKHNIKYFLAFGTLLGCVRDGGYIPWDDDVDLVVMPECWDKMNQILEAELDWDKYSLMNKKTHRKSPCWQYLTEVSVNGTFRRFDYFREEIAWKCGIVVDVFPLVKVPENRRIQKVWYWKLGILDGVIGIKGYKPGSRRIPFLSKCLYWTIFKDMDISRICEMRDRVQRKYNRECGKCLTVPFGPNGRYPLEKTLYQAEWFQSTVRKEFTVYRGGEAIDSAMFPIPLEYEKILKKTYGNWMKKPRGERTKGVSYWDNQGGFCENK
ncbi:MAG: LicD family protein, partial [Eubacterium sp.]|nr:LicD family protein [Eubacterium sp.]